MFQQLLCVAVDMFFFADSLGNLWSHHEKKSQTQLVRAALFGRPPAARSCIPRCLHVSVPQKLALICHSSVVEFDQASYVQVVSLDEHHTNAPRWYKVSTSFSLSSLNEWRGRFLFIGSSEGKTRIFDCPVRAFRGSDKEVLDIREIGKFDGVNLFSPQLLKIEEKMVFVDQMARWFGIMEGNTLQPKHRIENIGPFGVCNGMLAAWDGRRRAVVAPTMDTGENKIIVQFNGDFPFGAIPVSIGGIDSSFFALTEEYHLFRYHDSTGWEKIKD